MPVQTDEQSTRTAWRAFGSYIAKQMLNGKGVVVPHFGTFSFTAMNVDLAGTTNPQQRDKQFREPVFMVGKDFVNNITMKKGIAHTWGDVRPFDLKGANGIIPQVKINWVEVAVFGGLPKETAKEACEQVFRQMADTLRSGKPVNTEIPLVGRFVTRGTIAAVSFLPSLAEGTLGVTAKQFAVGKLFSSSNTVLNMNIHKDEDIKRNPSFMNGGNLGISDDATGWLKNNLDIDLDAFNKESGGDLVV
jgi:nucleoid DNA-binding protein